MLTLHRDVVQQKGECDGDDDRVAETLLDARLVEFLDDDGGPDLLSLDPVVGEDCGEMRMSVVLGGEQIRGTDSRFSSALNHLAVWGSAVMKNHLFRNMSGQSGTTTS